MDLVQLSFDDIQEKLLSFSSILRQQSETYDRLLATAKLSWDKPTMKEAQDMAEKWVLYREELMDETKAVTKVCDAIMVNATVALLPVPETRTAQTIRDVDRAGEIPRGKDRKGWKDYFISSIPVFARKKGRPDE